MKSRAFASIAITLVLAACGGNTPEAVAPATALPSDPSWTGVSRPKDVIAARERLMMQIEQLMIPIDGLEAGEKADAHTLAEHGRTIAAMLGVVPHLFPPTTNLFDAAAEQPETLALPAIWQNFDGFAALNQATVDAADALAAAEGLAAQKQAAQTLRAACAACHAVFLRPFKEATVEQSDVDFDFDAALGGGN